MAAAWRAHRQTGRPTGGGTGPGADQRARDQGPLRPTPACAAFVRSRRSRRFLMALGAPATEAHSSHPATLTHCNLAARGGRAH